MADLEVDQSKLPNVQEVRQCFAVLEDGALAHNLQEQEIEQYYCSNVQRSQLVQNDIRVAKRLQDEEQQRAFMLHRQATLKLEEQDSKYARRVQEEIQRCADEAQRREAEDEEIARQIQEEEELRIRECNDYQSTNTVKADAPAPSHALRPSRPAVAEEDERCRRASFSSSCSSSSSSSSSDYEEERRDRSRRIYEDCGEPEVHSVQPTRVPRRRSSLGHESQSSSHSNRTGPFQGRWGDVVKLIKTDLNEQGYLGYSSGDELFEPIYKLERVLSQRQQGLEPCGEHGKRLAHHSSMREGCVRTWQGEFAENFRKFQAYNDGRRVMAESRQVRRYNSSCSDSRSGERQRHVHFQDDRSGLNGYKDSRRGFGGIRERGSHYHGYHAAASGQYHLQTQVSHQSAQVRQVNPDVHRRRSLAHENHESRVAQISEEEYEDPDSLRAQRREGCGRRIIGQCRQRAHSLREERRWDRRGSERVYRGEQSGRRVRREHWQGYEEERSSTDEEEVERERERRREERRTRRLPKRSLSLSCRGRSSRAGAPLARDGASLHLGELEQVLLDEELARRLQQEEEKLLRRELPASSTLLNPYPEGDFRVAQVAQDEEIAHFMQKQEIRAKRCSQDQERCGSGQEYQDTAYHNDGRCRQMQRERLDSEGLLSPTEEDCSPEHQPSSPITMPVQAHHFRNIAEELDPTFQRKGSVHAAPNASGHCQIQASPQDGASSRVLAEEPAFVAPTKRPNEKPGRVKSREKKDSPKLKENCKQQ